MPSKLNESRPPDDDGQKAPVQDDLQPQVDPPIVSGVRLAPLPSPGDEIEFDNTPPASLDSSRGTPLHGTSLHGTSLHGASSHGASPDNASPNSADAPFGNLDVTAWEQELWADPELEEFAAQLSVDAQFLAQCFPADAPQAPSELNARHAEQITPWQFATQQPTPTQLDESLSDAVVAPGNALGNALGNARRAIWTETEKEAAAQTMTWPQAGLATRRRFTRRLRDLMGITSIVVLLWFVGRPMFDRVNSSRDANVIGKANQPKISNSEAPDVQSQPPSSAISANLSEDDSRVASNANAPAVTPQPRPVIAREPSAAPSSLMSNGSFETTPVLYQPEVLFHASQAELEGILDIMRPSQDRRIRVAF